VHTTDQQQNTKSDATIKTLAPLPRAIKSIQPRPTLRVHQFLLHVPYPKVNSTSTNEYITHSQETCQSLPTTPSFDTQAIRAEQYGSSLPSSRLLWPWRLIKGPLPSGLSSKSATERIAITHFPHNKILLLPVVGQ
jgi:hypothetical protein